MLKGIICKFRNRNRLLQKSAVAWTGFWIVYARKCEGLSFIFLCYQLFKTCPCSSFVLTANHKVVMSDVVISLPTTIVFVFWNKQLRKFFSGLFVNIRLGHCIMTSRWRHYAITLVNICETMTCDTSGRLVCCSTTLCGN